MIGVVIDEMDIFSREFVVFFCYLPPRKNGIPLLIVPVLKISFSANRSCPPRLLRDLVQEWR